ncbi:MAG: type II toxin-antitoxin system death-on-curing family toxin [Nitrososphaerales archaeon]
MVKVVIRYPTYEAVIEAHKRIVKASGGTAGVLSISNLQYILDTLEDIGKGSELDKLICKTAYILYNIVTLHPFVDGNKRTAFEAAKAFLQLNAEDFDAEEDESFNMLISVAKGELNVSDVEVWIRKHLKQRSE